MTERKLSEPSHREESQLLYCFQNMNLQDSIIGFKYEGQPNCYHLCITSQYDPRQCDLAARIYGGIQGYFHGKGYIGHERGCAPQRRLWVPALKLNVLSLSLIKT